PGPNLVTGDQLVEAHDLAPPPVAVVGGGLAALIERTATASAAVLACTPAAPAIPGMEAIAWITPALCQQRKFNHMVVTVARYEIRRAERVFPMKVSRCGRHPKSWKLHSLRLGSESGLLDWQPPHGTP